MRRPATPSAPPLASLPSRALCLGVLSLAIAGGLAGAVPAPQPPTAPPDSEVTAADPFYLALLDDGIRSYTAGDLASAARTLRLACFGLLEQPERLGHCLAWLGAAQGRLDDRGSFVETFERLAALEQRFEVYRSLDLPDGVRSELERALALWIPGERLSAIPAFNDMAEWQEASRLSRLAPPERREELARRREAEPDNPRWILMLVDLELLENDLPAARTLVEEALAAEPGQPRALCTRGLIEARQGRCREAVADLAPCARARQDPDLAEALLGCQIGLGQWAEAGQFLDELPAEITADRRLARQVRQVQRQRDRPSSERTPPPPIPPPDPSPPSTGEARPTAERPSPEERLSPEEEGQLAAARRLLASIRTSPELEIPLAMAREVADAHPGHREAQHLVAQIAYRASRFATSVDYFRRGGDPGREQPLLLFFYAVSLYETAQRQEAAEVLRRCLPLLDSNAFVEGYRQKILGEAPPPG